MLDQTQNRGGFTKLEVFLAVLAIILGAWAFPYFVRHRARPAPSNCIAALKQIEGAKELWATDNRCSNGTPCFMTNLAPAYLKFEPFCFLGAQPYEVRPVGESPACPHYTPAMREAGQHALHPGRPSSPGKPGR
jgi:hypothetical protein